MLSSSLVLLQPSVEILAFPFRLGDAERMAAAEKNGTRKFSEKQECTQLTVFAIEQPPAFLHFPSVHTKALCSAAFFSASVLCTTLKVRASFQFGRFSLSVLHLCAVTSYEIFGFCEAVLSPMRKRDEKERAESKTM